MIASARQFSNGLAMCFAMGLAAISLAVPAKERPARLESSSQAPTATMMTAHFDMGNGTCTAGSMQLMSKDALVSLKQSWNDESTSANCEEPRKKSTPHGAAYPKNEKGKRITGAAHLLVLLERDGSVASISPVCTTGQAFADAAIATTKTISFTPRRCDGTSLRTTFLLPFAYDP